MKKIIYLLIVLGLSFQMTSCEKSEDESYSSKIIGTWSFVKMWEEGFGTSEWDGNDEEYMHLIFKKDGTGMFSEYSSYHDEILEERFTWTIVNEQINFKYVDDIAFEDNLGTISTINTLTDKELVIEHFSSKDQERWREYYVRVK